MRGVINDNKGLPLINGGAVLLLLVAAFVGLDPFRWNVLRDDPEFQAKPVAQPSLWTSFPADARNRLKHHSRKWPLGHGLIGPESLAAHHPGQSGSGRPISSSFFISLADGRIMKRDMDSWVPFAYTSPNRTRPMCEEGRRGGNLAERLSESEHVCGRPLGLRFDKANGRLLIADAYLGLLSVGSEGGLATPLATHADGLPIRFANDLDVSSDGAVYFTDTSLKYRRRDVFLSVLSGDDSGRVVMYEPTSKTTNVVLKGLQFPNGVCLSQDESFLVIAESLPGRLLRHWLKGEKAGTTEVMAVLPGYPDNVRTNEKGEFWVAMHSRRNLVKWLFGNFPRLRRAFLQIPIPFKQLRYIFNGCRPAHGIVAKYNKEGDLLDILEDVNGDIVQYASEVMEQLDGSLWIGSVHLPYIAIYKGDLV